LDECPRGHACCQKPAPKCPVENQTCNPDGIFCCSDGEWHISNDADAKSTCMKQKLFPSKQCPRTEIGSICKSGGVETGSYFERDCPPGTSCEPKRDLVALGGEADWTCQLSCDAVACMQPVCEGEAEPIYIPGQCCPRCPKQKPSDCATRPWESAEKQKFCGSCGAEPCASEEVNTLCLPVSVDDDCDGDCARYQCVAPVQCPLTDEEPDWGPEQREKCCLGSNIWCKQDKPSLAEERCHKKVDTPADVSLRIKLLEGPYCEMVEVESGAVAGAGDGTKPTEAEHDAYVRRVGWFWATPMVNKSFCTGFQAGQTCVRISLDKDCVKKSQDGCVEASDECAEATPEKVLAELALWAGVQDAEALQIMTDFLSSQDTTMIGFGSFVVIKKDAKDKGLQWENDGCAWGLECDAEDNAWGMCKCKMFMWPPRTALCTSATDCNKGQKCGGCQPSMCKCDSKTGITCTKDCNSICLDVMVTLPTTDDLKESATQAKQDFLASSETVVGQVPEVSEDTMSELTAIAATVFSDEDPDNVVKLVSFVLTYPKALSEDEQSRLTDLYCTEYIDGQDIFTAAQIRCTLTEITGRRLLEDKVYSYGMTVETSLSDEPEGQMAMGEAAASSLSLAAVAVAGLFFAM